MEQPIVQWAEMKADAPKAGKWLERDLANDVISELLDLGVWFEVTPGVTQKLFVAVAESQRMKLYEIIGKVL